MSELAAWVRDPALGPLWAAARARLERNAVQARGVVTVRGLDRPARRAVGGLLGREVLTDHARVDLAVLDAVLHTRSGVGGLVACLERLAGPVRNKVAERSAADQARELPYERARDWLSNRPVGGWVETWLNDVRRSGVLMRVSDAELAAATLVRALAVVARLLDGPDLRIARTQLAAQDLGDAHGLDDGTLLAHLVLRALGVLEGTNGVPSGAAERRALWERHGVQADGVSSTCLTLGLRSAGGSAFERRLCFAADAGDPVHVTAWDLRRGTLDTAAPWVLVCENPRVLEAVAQTHGGAVPVVCTAGVPGLVTLDVLARLAAGQAHLAYHGDFDWPGITIANRLVATHGCTPWLMGDADYRGAARSDGLALTGPQVEPAWDPRLGAAMRRVGTAVHEEAVLGDLLERLRCP